MTIDAVRGAPPVPGRTPHRSMTALMSACVVTVVAMVAATNLAIPKLAASDLRPSSTELLWIVDVYVLIFGCLLIPAGALGDRYGRKGVLLLGLGVFAAGCLLTAAAPGIGLLLAGRVVTGVGAALVMPATLSLLLQVTEPDRRRQAVASWTAATGAAGALGNIGGGAAIEYLPWEGLFLATVPITLVLLVLVARVAPRGERHPADLDLPGSALLVLAVSALLFGIIEGPEQGWTSLLVVGAFSLAVVAGGVFLAYALRAAHPVLDPRVFARARLWSGTLGIVAAFFGLFALFFMNAQFLQYAMGFSPLTTGLAIGPLALGMILVTRSSITLAARVGERTMVVGGLVLLVAALLLLSLTDASTPYLWYGLLLFVLASGMGMCLPLFSSAVMGALPPERAGMGSGLNGAAREIGSALGVAVLGTIVSSHFTPALPDGVHARSVGAALSGVDAAHRAQVVTAFTDAISVGYRIIAVVLAVVAIVVVSGFRRTG